MSTLPATRDSRITPPDITPELPVFTNQEIDEALEDLNLHGLTSHQIKDLRTIGQVVRSSGVISIGRGILMLSTGQVMDLVKEAQAESEDCADPELKLKYLTLRQTLAHELQTAGKSMVESEEAKVHDPIKPAGRLPAFGEQVGKHNLTQVNVHAGGKVEIRDGKPTTTTDE